MDRITMNINTGKADNYLDFKPDFKEPRKKKDGSIYASDSSVEEQLAEFEQRCALNSFTGRVINIAFKFNNEPVVLFNYDGEKPTDDSEKKMLESFWRKYVYDSTSMWITFNGTDFDWPFLIQRSWILGVPVPATINFRDREIPNHFDLMRIWHKFVYGKKISLETMAKALGAGVKRQGISEKYEWYWEHEHDVAVAYAIEEAELTYNCSLIMIN